MQKIAEIRELIAQVPERVRLWCQMGRWCFFFGRFCPFCSTHPRYGWEGFKHMKVEVAMELGIAWCVFVCTSSLLFLCVYQLPVVFVCVPAPCCFYVYKLPVVFICVPAPCCFCMCTSSLLFLYVYQLPVVFVCYQLPVVFICVPAPCCFYMCTSSLLFLDVYQLSVVFICVPAPCCFCMCTSSLLFLYVTSSLLFLYVTGSLLFLYVTSSLLFLYVTSSLLFLYVYQLPVVHLSFCILFLIPFFSTHPPPSHPTIYITMGICTTVGLSNKVEGGSYVKCGHSGGAQQFVCKVAQITELRNREGAQQGVRWFSDNMHMWDRSSGTPGAP